MAIAPEDAGRSLAVVALTPGGASLARRLGELLGAAVHLPEEFRQQDGCVYFGKPLSRYLPRLFKSGTGLVCIMATGIAVRLLASHLRGKEKDPPVVVVDEAGRFAVSLLGGHLGGANELARTVARLTGGEAVITTATDCRDLPAWDDAARRHGLGVEPLANIKNLNGLLLRGEPIALVDRRGRVAGEFSAVPGVRVCASFAEALQLPVAGRVFVTHRHLPLLEERTDILVLRPRDLVLGLGCHRGITAGEIEAAMNEEMARAFLSPASLGRLATITARGEEPGVREFVRRRQLALDVHPPEALDGVTVPSPPSPHVRRAFGAGGVCEPAALLSASGGGLLITKKRRGNLTLAVAEQP